MTTLVAMPFRGAPELLGRAVESVLAQTDRDLVCMVLGDGVPVPELGVRDDRLVTATWPGHHGPPFLQQAMLLGSPHEHYAPFGADDFADPDHLELMGSYGRPNVCAGAVWWHKGADAPVDHVLPEDWASGARRNYEVGRFTAADLRSVGGYGAHERFGQDNLLLHILARTLGLVASDRPTYHRIRRPGSLTTEPATGLRSPAREAVRHRNWDLVHRLRARNLIASAPVRAPIRADRLERLRAFRAEMLPRPVSAELEDAAAAVSRLLA